MSAACRGSTATSACTAPRLKAAPLNLASALGAAVLRGPPCAWSAALLHMLPLLRLARDQGCAGALTAQILQPSLFLHAQPTGKGVVSRAFSSLENTLPLLSVLGRKPGHGVFSQHGSRPSCGSPSHTYSLRRQIDMAATGGSVRPLTPSRRGSVARPTSQLRPGDANAA